MTATVRSVLSASLICFVYAQLEDCGTSVAPLISGGRPVLRGEFPWLAALYMLGDSGTWEQKCGGTLITARIVLTAAHCVVSFDGIIRPEDIKVGLGKLTRSYYAEEEDAIIINVNKIVVPETYTGSVASFALDIGLLQLVDSVNHNNMIKPVCVDWANYKTVNTGSRVYVAGWGTSENGSSTEAALTADMTYVDYNSCLSRIRQSYRTYVTHDKFCALSRNGGQVDRGDSGGGLTVVSQNRFYVIVVVSTKVIDQTAFSIFTSVADRGVHAWLTQQTSRLNGTGEEYVLVVALLRRDIKYPLGDRPRDPLSQLVFKGNFDAYGLGKITVTITRAKQEKRYILRNVAVNWYQAFQNCQAEGKRLATINSEEENNILRNMFKRIPVSFPFRFWISLTDLAEEGKYIWMSTGDPVGYTSWANSPQYGYQPDNAGGVENCVHGEFRKEVHLELPFWNDDKCAIEIPYICEYFEEV